MAEYPTLSHVPFRQAEIVWTQADSATPVVASPRWQAVADGFPEPGTWCWVWDRGQVRMAVHVPHTGDAWVLGVLGDADGLQVTHWQAIPVPMPPGEDA